MFVVIGNTRKRNLGGRSHLTTTLVDGFVQCSGSQFIGSNLWTPATENQLPINRQLNSRGPSKCTKEQLCQKGYEDPSVSQNRVHHQPPSSCLLWAALMTQMLYEGTVNISRLKLKDKLGARSRLAWGVHEHRPCPFPRGTVACGFCNPTKRSV
uniref:Uncharacterized protein n=1 Tax=Sphaerodactylus townsendi TaxID=933632 RepID=A0ACB8FLL9_9SAUR